MSAHRRRRRHGRHALTMTRRAHLALSVRYYWQATTSRTHNAVLGVVLFALFATL